MQCDARTGGELLCNHCWYASRSMTSFISTLVNAFSAAACPGNMALLVSNLNATAVRHQQKAELMQDSMRYLNVSSRVQARVQAWFL